MARPKKSEHQNNVIGLWCSKLVHSAMLQAFMELVLTCFSIFSSIFYMTCLKLFKAWCSLVTGPRSAFWFDIGHSSRCLGGTCGTGRLIHAASSIQCLSGHVWTVGGLSTKHHFKTKHPRLLCCSKDSAESHQLLWVILSVKRLDFLLVLAFWKGFLDPKF